MAAIYVHFPFCRSRCAYCGFYSQTNYGLAEKYIEALKEEIKQRQSYLEGQTVRTLYFGGGTPSSLPAGSILTIANAIRSAFTTEIEEFTVEVNPDDVNNRLLEEFHRAGVNRISMGVQTFDDELLRFLHRRHTAQQAIDAYRMMQQEGFDNISIDLILALPGQTLSQTAHDVEKAVELRPAHISTYLLEYEVGTELYKKLNANEIIEIEDDKQAEMYYQTCQILDKAGYEHYEISNFDRIDETGRKHRSLHNSSYWDNTIYLGLGAGAHSYNRMERRWNVCSVQKYICSALKGNAEHQQETIDEYKTYNELVMTRLRTVEGIRPNDIARLAPSDAEYLDTMAQRQIDQHMMERTSNHCLRLTRQALMTSDAVIASLFLDNDEE